MVTYYNKKDLISFGQYLLSQERIGRFKNNPNFPNDKLIAERMGEVHHSDVENWKESLKTTK